MATMLGSLLVSLGLESAQFDRGLTDARGKFRRASKDFETQGAKMERIGYQIGSSLRTIGGAAVIGGMALVGRELGRLVTTGLDYAASIAEQAEQLGVTTDALQEYRYAATQVGIAQGEMDKGLAFLSRTLGDLANGAKAPRDALARLGFSIKEMGELAAGGAGAAIPKLADAFQKLESPTQRAAIAADLFGAKLGGKFTTLLSGGSAAINNLRDAAHKLGIVLSSDQIQRADETADKLAAVKTVLQARIAGVVADNASAILGLANAMVSLVNAAGKAAGAFTKFKLAQGQFEAELNAGFYGLSPLASDQAKAAEYRKRAETFKAAQSNLNRPGGKMGGGGPGSIFDGSGRTADAAVAGVAIPTGGGGKKSRGGGGGSGPSQKDILARFNDELVGLTQQALSEMQSLAMSVDERAELELRSLELTRLRVLSQIKGDADYSSTQKLRLTQQVEEVARLERERVERDRQRQTEEETAQLTQQENEGKRERLQLQMDLAGTDKERQTIALALLDLDQQTQRLALERIIASGVRTDAEKALAQSALNQLNQNAGAVKDVVRRNTETPWQQYMREVQQSPDQINEAIDRINIDGLNSLNDGLVDALMGVRSLGDVFRSVANQIIADLLRIQIQKAIAGIISSVMGGVSAGFSPSAGLLADVDATQTANLSGAFAGGTNFAPGGLSLVGERGPELVNLPRGSKVFPNNISSQMMGGDVHKPTFVFPGVTNAKEAREAAGQAARRYRQEINGPIRRVS